MTGTPGSFCPEASTLESFSPPYAPFIAFVLGPHCACARGHGEEPPTATNAQVPGRVQVNPVRTERTERTEC